MMSVALAVEQGMGGGEDVEPAGYLARVPGHAPDRAAGSTIIAEAARGVAGARRIIAHSARSVGRGPEIGPDTVRTSGGATQITGDGAKTAADSTKIVGGRP